MLRELRAEVLGRRARDPRERAFPTEKRTLKALLQGDLWAHNAALRVSGRRGVRCLVSSRHLESAEEYEAHLDRLFQRGAQQKKQQR